MERLSYFIKRLLLIIPTFVGITLLCFVIIQFVPGGPVEQMIMRMRGGTSGEVGRGSAAARAVTQEYRHQLEVHFGFDQPVYRRYVKWLVTDLMGLKTESYKYPNQNAWQIIKRRFPVSIFFGVAGFILSYLVCIPLGIGKALRHGGTFDLASSVAVFVGYAIPPFALGMALKMFVCGTVDNFWDIFPVAGFQSDNFNEMTLLQQSGDLFMHMFLPVLCNWIMPKQI